MKKVQKTVKVVKSLRIPRIGILTQPKTNGNLSYVADSYLQWVEKAGASAFPVPYDINNDDFSFLVDHLEGFVFPGGGMDLKFDTPFLNKSKRIYEKCIERSQKKDDFFPIFGICQGFQALLILSSLNDKILQSINATSVWKSLMLEDTEKKTHFSKYFYEMKKLKEKMNKGRRLVFHNNLLGITVGKFNNYKSLCDFYSIVYSSVDDDKQNFVNIIESKKYPIFASQFHPEKPLYEKVSLNLHNKKIYDIVFDDEEHQNDSLELNNSIAEFFVKQCRGKFIKGGEKVNEKVEKRMEELYSKIMSKGKPGKGKTFQKKYTFPKF